MPEIRRFVMKHYLDVPMILRISRYLKEPKSKKQIAEFGGMGQPKVRGLLEWGRHLGVIELREDGTYMVTRLGRYTHEIRSRYLYEILYWELVNEHRAIKTIVNDFLYSTEKFPSW
jgi:DNA-binding transcriptional regulator LsrR (DeoR family)